MPNLGERMKKLINDPLDAVDQLVAAFAAAHSEVVTRSAPRVISRAKASSHKVGLTIGGGSGHEPAFLGYVGHGLADSAAIGGVFAAPSPDSVLDAIRSANTGMGVVLVYGNYSGDVLNCRLAARRAADEGIDVRQIFVSDDVASAPREDADRRRGIAGDILVFKAAGAAAEARMTLDDVERVALKANANTRSMGVALSGVELPGAAQPVFQSPPGMMEVGLGVHGEPGVSSAPLGSADEVGQLLTDRVLEDLDPPAGCRLAVLVNGLGATPVIEQYIVYGAVRSRLLKLGFRPERSYVGEYITSLQMAGISVSVTALDDELLELLDAPAQGVAFSR